MMRLQYRWGDGHRETDEGHRIEASASGRSMLCEVVYMYLSSVLLLLLLLLLAVLCLECAHAGWACFLMYPVGR